MSRRPAAARRRAAPAPLSRALRLPLRNPALSLALTLASAFAGAIAVNALVMQSGRHPAPLFGAFADAPAMTSAPVPVPAPATAPVQPAQTPSASEPRRKSIEALLGSRPATVPIPRPKATPNG
jgi:hypothetical protein